MEQNTVTTSKTNALYRTLCKRWLTPLEAVAECGIFSLSQRCGEFRREGHVVLDRWVTLPSGSRVKAYTISKPTSWTA
jgi:hypothetical protein